MMVTNKFRPDMKDSIFTSPMNERNARLFFSMTDHHRLNEPREIGSLIKINRLLFVLVEQKAWLMDPKKILL